MLEELCTRSGIPEGNSGEKRVEILRKSQKKILILKGTTREEEKVKRYKMNTLPQALVVKILGELPLYSIYAISLVCKEWKKLSQDDPLWQRFYLARFRINEKYGRIQEKYEKDHNSPTWKKKYEVGVNWRKRHCYSSNSVRAHSQAGKKKQI